MTPAQMSAYLVNVRGSKLFTNIDIINALDEAILAIAAGASPSQSYSIGGRSMVFINIEQAYKVRDSYTNAPEAGDRSYISQCAEL